MIRNVKVLGLALVAMLAISAVVASGSSVASFDAPSGLTKLTASQESKFEHTFTVAAGAVTCESASFSGEASGSGLGSIEVTPVYTGCLFAGNTATVNMNGCKYMLEEISKVSILCPKGKEITITAPSLGTAKCTIHIREQVFLHTVSYTNVGATSPTKEITVTANVSQIIYSQTEGSGLGKCASGPGVGFYTGRALATGENLAATAHTDIIRT